MSQLINLIVLGEIDEELAQEQVAKLPNGAELDSISMLHSSFGLNFLELYPEAE